MATMTAFLVSPAPGDFHVPSAKAGMVCPEARVMVGPPTATLAFFAAGSDIVLKRRYELYWGRKQKKKGLGEGCSDVVGVCWY